VLNAHHLIYLTLLVADNQLPAEVLKVFYFSSQTCQNFFRLTQAISGTFSVSANFTIQQYLDRQEKISMLNSIKTEKSSSFTKTKFEFPNHHKKR
jgi:capsule polysaccharide export protein KpsE/RkpR